jgi:hypothetical protein
MDISRGRLLAIFLALAPAARAAGPSESELGAAVKWDILTAARLARSQVPDACLCKADATLAPDGDMFMGHFWSEKKHAYYRVRVRGHSEVPDDMETGDTSPSPVCIRDVPIGADRALAIAYKHGLTPPVGDARMRLELLKIDKESMGDDHFIYNNIRAARGRAVWVLVPGEFLAHGDYSALPLGD